MKATSDYLVGGGWLPLTRQSEVTFPPTNLHIYQQTMENWVSHLQQGDRMWPLPELSSGAHTLSRLI